MASSDGDSGGEKKLKNESMGRALRTRRVRLVSEKKVTSVLFAIYQTVHFYSSAS